MNSILVGVDESASAAAALRWAVREGHLHDWPVTAMLAWGYLDQHHGTGPNEFDPDYGEGAAAAVLDEVIQAVGPTGAAIGRTVVCDLPGRALVEAAAEAELLVVGARGLGGFRGLLLGSVSRHCLHHATCPVAVIRSTEHLADDAAGRVVVGVDGSDTSVQALAWGVHESRARQSPLTIVHMYRPAYLGAIEYAAPALDPDMLEQAAHQTVDRALVGIDTSGLPAHPERVVAVGSAAGGILDAARGASLVVVGSRGQGGVKGFVLGSVSQQVTQHAPCPTIVVPPADRAPSTLSRAT